MDRDDLRLLEKVKDWCKKTRLLKPGDAVLLACSGGPDSLALVDVFLRLQPQADPAFFIRIPTVPAAIMTGPEYKIPASEQ